MFRKILNRAVSCKKHEADFPRILPLVKTLNIKWNNDIRIHNSQPDMELGLPVCKTCNKILFLPQFHHVQFYSIYASECAGDDRTGVESSFES